MKRLARLLLLVLMLFTATDALAQSRAAREEMARQMLAETNVARSSPQRYLGYLKELRGHFVGRGYLVPGAPALVLTTEGGAALDEAVRFLERQKPLPPLAWSPGLALGAADLVRDQGPSGEIGHTGNRSGDMRERIERYGTWQGRIAENIGYGPDTARQMVMQLIIDDGVPERGHRKNIFTSAFKVAGAACGAHAVYRTMCAMEFAVGFTKSR
ncbi:serine protease [Geomonas silvestris]|uniref:Serine protease n=1 Tax=Geomonas silvestris TaxID=2740184 RepID=A0A6V8MEQ8_9BACT|nr:CAP domain-containing protein [Geomonas silvestris]GFO58334.1 serine protease [Geomonas silvestris]